MLAGTLALFDAGAITGAIYICCSTSSYASIFYPPFGYYLRGVKGVVVCFYPDIEFLVVDQVCTSYVVTIHR